MIKAIKRELTLNIKSEELAKSLGIKIEYDPFDDVYYDIQSVDPRHLDISNSLRSVCSLFPIELDAAVENIERSAYVNELEKLSRDALIESLLMIAVAGEYTGLNSEGEEVWVSEPSCVKNAVFEDYDTVSVTLENPEHLINDLINGEGLFYTTEILIDVPQDGSIKSHIHYLGKYFEIYGESVLSANDRHLSPNYSSEELEQAIKDQLSTIEQEQIVEVIKDAKNPKECATLISEYIEGLNMDQLLKEAKELFEKEVKEYQLELSKFG